MKIIAHFDGHGVALAALAARYYNLPLDSVIAYRYPVTAPENFHKLSEFVAPGVLYSDNEYLILDIPINVKDPDIFMRGFHAIFQNARKLTGRPVTIMYFDHHATNLQFLRLLPAFVKYIHFPDAYSLNLHFVRPDNRDERHLAMIGAICDRDRAVLPDLEREEELIRDELLTWAAGLDYLVRNDPERALRACYNLDFATLRNAARNIPEPPPNIELLEGVVLCLDELTPAWSPKQLEQLCIRNNVPYAVGFVQDPRTKTWVVRAVTLWTSNAPPVKNLIENIIGSRNCYGHPAAPVIACVDRNDAERFARTVAETISQRVREQKITAREEKLRDLLSVLVEILDEQRKLYREYLELKRKQVELLERAEGSSARRYD